VFVRIVASTTLDYDALVHTGYASHISRRIEEEPEPVVNGEPSPEWKTWMREYIPLDIDELHEAAGRIWDHSASNTENREYLRASVIDAEHFQVLAHGHATVYADGISRSLLHELRQPGINLSVLSQRYLDANKMGVVTPPLFTFAERTSLQEHFEMSLQRYSQAYDDLIKRGMTVPEARGAARAYLPEATETKILMTASIGTYRDIITKRASDAADEEVRLFALALLRQLRRVCPNSVQDLVEELLDR